MQRHSELQGAGDSLARRLLDWQGQHGRQDLPWQNTRDPYRVWLSEIMLQQTQVTTVLGYFSRFLQQFPEVGALARAPQDEVLSLWAGLGYYSRARNLHRCAQDVMQLHAGDFPRSSAQLQTLPGIGRSTAAAIASLCFGERVAILDGNVKRVLTRYLGFDADLAKSANERALWAEATRLLPEEDLYHSMPRYTQGIMDLGATVCSAKKPRCKICPLQVQCRAFLQGSPEGYPVKTRQLKRSTQTIWMLWATTDDGALWLSRRPVPGVWAGLYCFALFNGLAVLQATLPTPMQTKMLMMPAIKHVLTHKDLYLHPVRVVLTRDTRPGSDGAWFEASQWAQLGIPTPVKKLLIG